MASVSPQHPSFRGPSFGLDREAQAERAWDAKFTPKGCGGVLPLDPFGEGCDSPARLRGAALSPSGEDVAYFGGDVARSHVVRVASGPEARRSVSISHPGVAVAATFDVTGRLAVATDAGRVVLYHVPPTRPDEVPRPAGTLALPSQQLGPCRALLPLRGGSAIVARCQRSLATWSLGAVDDGPQGHDGTAPTGQRLPSPAAPLLGLTGDEDTRRLVAWNGAGVAQHLLPAEGGLVEDCTVTASGGGAPGPQTWAVASGANVVARVNDADVSLFDLRRSAHAASCTLSWGEGAGARLQAVRPFGGTRWLAASADGYLFVLDATQPKVPLAELPLVEAPMKSQRTTGLYVDADCKLVAVAGAGGMRIAAALSRPAPSFLTAVRFERHGSVDVDLLEQLVYERDSDDDVLTDVHFFPRGRRLLLRNDRQLYCWRPNDDEQYFNAVQLDEATLHDRRLPVGAACEEPVVQQSYARVLPRLSHAPVQRRPIEAQLRVTRDFLA